MISYALKPAPALRQRFLGQAAVPIVIAVTDFTGRPVSGAAVSVEEGGSGETDSAGILRTTAPQGRSLSVRVERDSHLVFKEFPAGTRGNLYVHIPVCFNQPFLTTAEIVALLAAAGLTSAGFYWKVEALKVTGEVLFGAAAFTAIYRLSCL